MTMKLDTLVRLGLLVFIVFIAAYFLYTNELSKRDTQGQGRGRESFVVSEESEGVVSEESGSVDTDADARGIILDVYQQVLGRAPTSTELLTAYEVYTNNDKKRSALEVYLKFTDEFRKKTNAAPVSNGLLGGNSGSGSGSGVSGNSGSGSTTFPISLVQNRSEETGEVSTQASVSASKETQLKAQLAGIDTEGETQQTKVNLREQLQVYRTIINVFEEVLARLPTNAELDRFYGVIKGDATFTVDKLKQNLMESEEYKRLQKLQSNEVHAELPGSVTDAQVTMKVLDIYGEVHGEQKPASALLEFLKTKYVSYNLNDDRLRQLILLMRDLDAGGSQARVQTSLGSTGSGGIASGWLADSMRVDQAPVSRAGRAANADYQQLLTPSMQQMKQAMDERLALQRQHQQRQQGQQGQQGQQEKGRAAQFDVNACESMLSAMDSRPRELSQLIEKRNRDQMGSACARSSYYMKIDSKLGYYGPGTANNENSGGKNMSACDAILPAWSDGAILGTPLEDAGNTSVGSIMPGFIYQELPRPSSS